MNTRIVVSRRRVRMVGGILLLLALWAWGLASPVGASPDEDYHLVSTWCGQGLRADLCEPGPSPGQRAVPTVLPPIASCFAMQPETSASCQEASLSTGTRDLIVTDRGNFAGQYPPGFYFVMSHFVADDLAVSVIAMRFANALLFVAMIAVVFVLSQPGVRHALLVGTAVTVVPLGLFIVPALNPSSWAVTSASTFFLSVVGYMTEERRPRRLLLGVVAGLSMLVGAGARADAAMYAVLAVVTALVLTLGYGGRSGGRGIYPVILAIIAGFTFLTAGQSSVVDSSSSSPLTLHRLGTLTSTVPDLWVGVFGHLFGLGWLDTKMPPLVWVSGFGLFVAVAFAAIGSPNRRRGMAILLTGSAVWIVPAYIQYRTGFPVGNWVQPRYILPLLILFIVTALVRLEGRAFRLEKAQRWLAVVALSCSNALALHQNLRRYVTGTDLASLNLNAELEWWWTLPLSPLLVWFLGSAAFALAVTLLSAEVTSDRPAHDPEGMDATVESPRS